MVDFLVYGGKTMIPLVLCSLVSVTVIIERLISLRASHVVPVSISQSIDREAAIDEILNECRQTSCLSSIVHAILKHQGKSQAILDQHLLTLYKKEVSFLERGLGALEVIASITPLLGLLGTVLGMVDVFNVVAEIGVGQASALSSGIAKALVTTIVGLSIAIPTVVFHSYFSRKAEKLALDLEECSRAFVVRLSSN